MGSKNGFPSPLEDMATRAYFYLLWRVSFYDRVFFCPLGKKEVIMRFWPILGHFLCRVVTLVTYGSNLNIFEKNKNKIKKKSKNIFKNWISILFFFSSKNPNIFIY